MDNHRSVLLRGLAGSLCVMLLLAASPGGAERPRIYKWVDSQGIAHYTTDPERIPAALRKRIEQATPEGAAETSPPAGTASDANGWALRDAPPRIPSAPLRMEGETGPLTPEQIEVRAAHQEDLDEQISALQAEIARDEDVLKGLISNPDLDAETPLFNRPEFLEISQRLPQLQAQLEALRAQRSRLETR